MKTTDKNYNALREEMNRIWGTNSHMSDYCCKQANQIVFVGDGDFIVIEKKSLEKDFWFGYSDCGQGLSYEENNDKMKNVSNNISQYFIERNIADLKEMIEQLQDETKRWFKIVNYSGGLHCVTLKTDDYLNRWGYNNPDYVEIDRKYIDDILEAYECELEARVKRCISYLKRFKNKINVNSYWVDR